ncbi:unnamed protein product [Moneuplotes crassus]|uniref:Uncharacterized protein n=1 Tax=Euplotes crassus TaxID=5936 RepID=A0AAD1UUN2_EUPCR|nr:unnamed protein product [Moneuplotes crassus]
MEENLGNNNDLIYYTVFLGVMTIPTLLLLVNTGFRTYKELKQDYYDLFRIGQYAFLIVYLVSWMFFYIFIMSSDIISVYEIAVCIASGTNMGYIVINLLLWVLIIIHLDNLVKKEEDIEKFIRNRRRIKRIEVISILFAMIICFTVLSLNGVSAWRSIQAKIDDKAQNSFDDVDKVSCWLSIALYVFFIVSEILLVMKLMKLVKKYCNYDKQYSKYFPWLAGSNVIYYTFQLITFIIMMVYKQTYCEISQLNKETKSSNYFPRIAKAVLFFFNNNLPLLYAYLNIKNVSFKLYIVNTLAGIHKPNLCPARISLFIVVSCKSDREVSQYEGSTVGEPSINEYSSDRPDVYLLYEDMDQDEPRIVNPVNILN